MRQFYQVNAFDTYHDSIDGDRTYWIPPVECPTCKVYAGACSLSYPWIKGAELFDAKTLEKLRPESSADCSWSEYLEYAGRLRQALGNDFPVSPGAGIDGYIGRIKGRIGDMEMPLPYELFLKQWVVEALRKAGFELRQFDVTLKGKKMSDLVEIWLPPIGLAANVTLCPECGRSPGKQYSKTVLAASVPDTAHCFVIRNEPGYAVFSGEFVDAVKRLKVKGVRFEKLEVA